MNSLKARGKYIRIEEGVSKLAKENDIVFSTETKEILVDGKSYGKIYGLRLSGSVLSIFDSNGEESSVQLPESVSSKDFFIKQVPSDNPLVTKAYQLQTANGDVLGETIEISRTAAIYKIYQGYVDDVVDQDTGAIASGTGASALCIIYFKDNKYVLDTFSFTGFNAGAGLGWLDNTLYIKKSQADEGYLQIDRDGIAVVGLDEKFRKIEGTIPDKKNVVNEITRFVHSIQDNTRYLYYKQGGEERYIDLGVPLATSSYAGLMSAEDKRKLETTQGIVKIYAGHEDDLVDVASGTIYDGTGEFAICVISCNDGVYSIETITLETASSSGGSQIKSFHLTNDDFVELSFMDGDQEKTLSVDLSTLTKEISDYDIDLIINKVYNQE